MSTHRGNYTVDFFGAEIQLDVVAEYTVSPIQATSRYEPTDGGVELTSLSAVINDQPVNLELCEELADAVCRSIYEERLHANLDDVA